ncbi:MAG TPA: hypothetical protein VFD52_01905, partial [Clostridia bacterium]|nr:hypothetical protein [Clostridia bacterium]
VTDNLNLLNCYDSEIAKNIIFSLGMVEAVSYWKCACPENVVIKCGYLSENDILWWKKLWFNGLSEMFYQNKINTDIESFVNFSVDYKLTQNESDLQFESADLNIVPIGGGKDSVVTLEMLQSLKSKTKGFTINDQLARTECASVAGLGDENIIKTYRTIDQQLMKLNSQGFLNGHTPFSAIVAFLSLYCAYITGADNIILSNEASANDANIQGTNVNHQYSKSYEFENDFKKYTAEKFGLPIHYFSVLRPFNELQIAKQFAMLKDYHSVFKSCNVGSKENIWCGHCAKCLFVYIILSPFIQTKELKDIFSVDMLDDKDLIDDFRALAGFSDVKPFECIGTVEEVCCALDLAIKKYESQAEELPILLEYYIKNKKEEIDCNRIFSEFNDENNIPKEFSEFVEEMYRYVSECD